MTYKVTFTENTYSDLDTIQKHLEQYSSTAFSRLLAELECRTEILRDFPQIFAQSNRIANCRQIVIGDYLALYTIDEKKGKVTIRAVIHASRDIERQVGDRVPNPK